MDIDDGVTLRARDDPTIKNELRRAWIADRLDERLGEFGETHAVEARGGAAPVRRRRGVPGAAAESSSARVPREVPSATPSKLP